MIFKVYCICFFVCVGCVFEVGKVLNEVNWWFYFFVVCRYFIIDEGCKLVEKLESVIGDSLLLVLISSVVYFIIDLVKFLLYVLIDLIFDGNLDNNYLFVVEVFRDFKFCEEKILNSYDRFIRVIEREEEFKFVRCGFGKIYFESEFNCLFLFGNCCKVCEEIVVYCFILSYFVCYEWYFDFEFLNEFF